MSWARITNSSDMWDFIPCNENLNQKQLRISKVCEDIDKLEFALTAGDVDIKMLLAFLESLESMCEELKNLKSQMDSLIRDFFYSSMKQRNL